MDELYTRPYKMKIAESISLHKARQVAGKEKWQTNIQNVKASI